MAAYVSPEPHLRPDADAHPELCRVDGCEDRPTARGVCPRHYGLLRFKGKWRSKASNIMLAPKTTPARVPATTPDDPRDLRVAGILADRRVPAAVEARLEREDAEAREILRKHAALTAEHQALTVERNNLLVERAQLLLAARLRDSRAERYHALLTEAGAPTPEEDEGNADLETRIRWLVGRVKTLERARLPLRPKRLLEAAAAFAVRVRGELAGRGVSHG